MIPKNIKWDWPVKNYHFPAECSVIFPPSAINFASEGWTNKDGGFDRWNSSTRKILQIIAPSCIATKCTFFGCLLFPSTHQRISWVNKYSKDLVSRFEGRLTGEARYLMPLKEKNPLCSLIFMSCPVRGDFEQDTQFQLCFIYHWLDIHLLNVTKPISHSTYAHQAVIYHQLVFGNAPLVFKHVQVLYSKLPTKSIIHVLCLVTPGLANFIRHCFTLPFCDFISSIVPNLET